jgi:hypothetical protein
MDKKKKWQDSSSSGDEDDFRPSTSSRKKRKNNVKVNIPNIFYCLNMFEELNHFRRTKKAFTE